MILLEAMVARMALEDMANQVEDLQATRERIRELMQAYKEQPSQALKDRIRREIQRFKQKLAAIKQMMKQLQKKVPQEFLNLDGMKSDEVVDHRIYVYS